MKIKSSLHIHTTEDPVDGYAIKYNVYKLIDKAHEMGFKVLALTCHRKYIYRPEYGDYAKAKGILLIPGIELPMSRFMFWRNDTIILNCEKQAEKIENFRELKEYKNKHKEIFILAAHPGYGRRQAMGIKKLKKYIDLFDAIEHSWFYTKNIDFNKRAEKIAKKYNKPFVATADAHSLDYLNSDYAIIEAEELTVEDIFAAIRQEKFTNITKEKKLHQLFFFMLKHKIRSLILFPFKICHNKKYL